MALGCGAKCLKYTLFAFNLIFFIMGVVCVVLGVWLVVDENALDRLANAAEKVQADKAQDDIKSIASATRAIKTIGVILAVGGGIIFIIAFLGCCGAVKEWRPLLILYAICLMLILAVEVAAAIYASINRAELESELKGFFKTTLTLYNGTVTETERSNNADTLVKFAWDQTMIEYDCCGIASQLGEFKDSGWYKQTGEVHDFPPACCPKIDGKLRSSCGKEDRHKSGCYTKVRDSILSRLGIVIGVAAGVAVLQVIGLIMAFCLCKAISDESVYS